MKKSLIACLLALFALSSARAQDTAPGTGRPAAEKQLVRLSKIEVDPARLDAYNLYLREEIEASLRLEPGVVALYAVAAKDRPNEVTILEIYADQAAYKHHIGTPHFRKYKEGTLDMVQSLELLDVVPLLPESRIRHTLPD